MHPMGVTVEKQGGVALIHLNTPPANSYNHDIYEQIENAIDEVRWSPETKVAVIVSDVPKFFSAGADINYLRTTDPVLKTQFCLHCNETLDKMARSPQVFIACVEGHCVGGGLELAMGADLIFAEDSEKIQIGLPEVKLGVLPGTGGTQRMARRIGPHKALDLCATGDLLSPQQAQAIGLIDKVFPAGEGRARTLAYAQRLADSAAYAVSNIKLSIMNGIEMPLNVSIRYEGELQNLLFRSGDAKEGLASFLEKRKANWSGR